MYTILCCYILYLGFSLLIIWRFLNELEPKNIKGFGEEKPKGKESEMADLGALKGKEFVCDLENSPSKEAMHEVGETKEMETGMENWDFIIDVGLPDLAEFTEIVKEYIKNVKENYGKNLLKEVEKKLEKVKEKYREEYKAWKEQENCLFAMLSSETTRAELYCLQAKENEEKLRKLEEEKCELMEKLCSANVKSELYLPGPPA